jgi:transposase
MRKGIDGLSMLVQGVLHQDPFTGHLFVFRGRQMHLYVRGKQRRHATVSASVISMETNAGGASSCFHRRRTRPSIP